MGCECHQIGGPFISYDPDCEVHAPGGLGEQVEELRNKVYTLEVENKLLKERVRALEEERDD